MKKLALFFSIVGLILNSQLVKADEVQINEVDASGISEGHSNVSGEDPEQVDPAYSEQDSEVLTGEIQNQNDSEENNTDSQASDPEYGQLCDLVQEFADSVGTYINFSYKMQIVNVAMLSVIAGSSIAFAIFEHFRD